MRDLAHTDEPDFNQLAAGELFLGKYEVTALIGRGSHGSVYHARHHFLNHSVAIKLQRRQGGVKEEAFLRARAEAQILVQVQHPNVVQVLDAGVTRDGLLYIVMEYLPGRSFREVLREHTRLTVAELLGFAAQVADGAAAAHALDVIHRDIKPENVFVLPGNRGKLLDFGVAKFLNAGWVTHKDTVLGTILYMSPEQFQAERLTDRSDIYSLGILMYEALSGQHPVQMLQRSPSPTMWDIARAVVQRMPPLLSDLDDTIPTYVAALIQRAISKEPGDRFGSMREFSHEIRQCDVSHREEARQRRHPWIVRDLSLSLASVADSTAVVPADAAGAHEALTVPAPQNPPPAKTVRVDYMAAQQVARIAQPVAVVVTSLAPPLSKAPIRPSESGERPLPSVIVTNDFQAEPSRPSGNATPLAQGRQTAPFLRPAIVRGLRIGALCGAVCGAGYMAYAGTTLWRLNAHRTSSTNAQLVAVAQANERRSAPPAPSTPSLPPVITSAAALTSATHEPIQSPPAAAVPARSARVRAVHPKPTSAASALPDMEELMKRFEADILSDRKKRLEAQRQNQHQAAPGAEP